MKYKKYESIWFVLFLLLVFFLLCCVPSKAETGISCQIKTIDAKANTVSVICPPSQFYSPLTATFRLSNPAGIPQQYQNQIVRLINKGQHSYDLILDKNKKLEMQFIGVSLEEHIYGK